MSSESNLVEVGASLKASALSERLVQFFIGNLLSWAWEDAIAFALHGSDVRHGRAIGHFYAAYTISAEPIREGTWRSALDAFLGTAGFAAGLYALRHHRGVCPGRIASALAELAAGPAEGGAS